jgi:hypothetical protein
MKRNINGALGALLVGGTLLSGLLLTKPAQADFFSERRHSSSSSRSRDFDRDGVPNYRDRDDDNDGIPDSRDRNDYSTNRGIFSNGRYNSSGRYYSGGRYYNSAPRRGAYGDLDRDGIRNRRDRDRDGDGRRNKRDDHPSDRRRR